VVSHRRSRARPAFFSVRGAPPILSI
jgi:hypothetical protein